MTNYVMPEYLWLVVVGSFAAFAFGWGTGSNDVANAFGTSVGARTLTLKQAVLIAIVFEFTGALLLGRVSTSVIAGGISQISYFQREPEIYAYGMVIALAVGFVWQGFASYCELNVSATHSIIGAIIGFSLVYGGGDAVNWATRDPGAFPPYKGVIAIVLSWFVSPILTGAASAFIFLTVRTLVLRHENAYGRTFWVLPIMVAVTTWINIYFVFTKGAKKALASSGGDWSDAKSAWVAAVCAAGLTALTICVALPLLRFKADNKFKEEAEKQKADEEAAMKGLHQLAPADGRTHSGESSNSAAGITPSTPGASPGAASGTSTPSRKTGDSTKGSGSESSFSKAMSTVRKAAMHGMEVDIHKVVEDDPIVAAIHKNAEQFDPKAEFAFSYLQVFSAICVILAHGAGEVGYMAGPLATIWYTVRDGALPSSVSAPLWIILISALGLVVGLATYGYNVTRAMGTRMAKLSPTRGFAAELATALVILVASQYGLPTSSSQCITGGIVGLGMLEGRTGVNWRFLAKVFASWVATLLVVAAVTAALFAQGAYAPSISANKALRTYEDSNIGTGQSIAKNINSTLYAYRPAAVAGRLSRLSAAQWSELNGSIAQYVAGGKGMLNTKKVGSIKAPEAVAYQNRALALLQQYSIVTLGQERVFPGAPACNDPRFSPAAPAFASPCPAPKPLAGLNAPYNATKW